MEIVDDPIAAARAAGLRYTSENVPGISRRRAGKGWSYRAADRSLIRDAETLQRIRALVIPPAWTNVWINPDPRGHIQVTGRDVRGRKQYLYHGAWRSFRDANKFARMVPFGTMLPTLRERVGADLALPDLPREKTLATVVRLLDESLMRIGNPEYARENGSYGLTTLRDDHVEIAGSTVRFVFRGKSGKMQEIDVRDKRVARIVRRMQDLPGQPLFQYLNGASEPRTIDSDDVNAYLQEITHEPISAKDFRTWGGSVLAAQALRELGPAETKTALKTNVVVAVDTVAARLGNTRTVCRASYIHPAVFAGYESGALFSFTGDGGCHPALQQDEQWLLSFLKEVEP
jgi:DNA topoisomerase-1